MVPGQRLDSDRHARALLGGGGASARRVELRHIRSNRSSKAGSDVATVIVVQKPRGTYPSSSNTTRIHKYQSQATAWTVAPIAAVSPVRQAADEQ